MNQLIEKLIAIATKEIGVHEEGGNNKGPNIIKYQQATWLVPGAWAWCAAFCAWVMREWMKDTEVMNHFGINALRVNTFRCRDASAFGWIKWATQSGFTVLPPTELAKAGDFVVFTFSHIAIVRADQVKITDPIETIEGNTNSHGDRDSFTGDGVLPKSRPVSLVKNYIRIINEINA